MESNLKSIINNHQFFRFEVQITTFGDKFSTSFTILTWLNVLFGRCYAAGGQWTATGAQRAGRHPAGEKELASRASHTARRSGDLHGAGQVVRQAAQCS